MSLEIILRTLDAAGVRYALIGAVALAARGVSRSTLDLDLLTTQRVVLSEDFWTTVRRAGRSVEVRLGDFDDPLAGVVRVHGDEPIDIVVGKYSWQGAVIERAEPVFVRGLTIPVPRKRDLVLLKLFAGGYRDLDDVRSLLAISEAEELTAEVESLLEGFPREMREAWQRIAEENES